MSLMKPNFEKDVVYLVQFPRPTTCPNMSPFCLKLETWLRMMEIKYEHVGNSFRTMSKKGQVPFIELNGEQLADSNLIIQELPGRFGKKSLDEHLSEEEKAQATALHALIEDKIFWNGCGFLAPSGRPMLESYGMLRDIPFLLKPIVVWKILQYFKNRAYYHGIGRHSVQEIAEFEKKDLKALSILLGNKPFFMGEKPTTLDSTAFGHLAAVYFQKSPLKEVREVFDFLNKECANLVAFIKRMVTKYYPDWNELAPESKPI
uniref:Glutathione S-transferase n=1 Tax=Plectus sambesii TaxID=2011161 RepID=A0A914VYQ2_9BILA